MPNHVDPLALPHVQADPDARKVVLNDWHPERVGTIEAALSAVAESIDITFLDGRTVSLELEDGAIRIHAYNRSCETPLSLRLPASGEIQVEREGYDADPKWSDEELQAQEATEEAPLSL